ncbi:MAG: cytochrome oxidase small assembly protein [Polynucleobacter sp.]|jgi:hypothetical protein|nr:cytochrome oxidase small assembly protein [Polynucleobacter sp.]
MDQQNKILSANKRMGFTLVSIAVAFFIAIILKKIVFPG